MKCEMCGMESPKKEKSEMAAAAKAPKAAPKAKAEGAYGSTDDLRAKFKQMKVAAKK